jgi:ribonuclease P protein component
MERLKKRADFLAAAAGVRCPTAGFVLLVRRREDGGPGRVGFTVSKKVGNAVERNRVRRRLKEMVRLAPVERIRPGHDYVLIGRRAALTGPFERLAGDLDSALRRADAPRPRTSRPPSGPRAQKPAEA